MSSSKAMFSPMPRLTASFNRLAWVTCTLKKPALKSSSVSLYSWIISTAAEVIACVMLSRVYIEACIGLAERDYALLSK